MISLYSYKGKNLTTLILMKMEHVSSLIADRESIPFDLAFYEFIKTRTFKNLQNTQTLLWGESAEYIVGDYYREIEEV